MAAVVVAALAVAAAFTANVVIGGVGGFCNGFGGGDADGGGPATALMRATEATDATVTIPVSTPAMTGVAEAGAAVAQNRK